MVAKLITKSRARRALDAVRGTAKTTTAEFDQLWHGMALQNGHTLAHELIHYNAERAVHHLRWQRALEKYDGPIRLIWGLDDPVSGRRVLDAARAILPDAAVTELEGVGHYPQSEAPTAVSQAIRAMN